MKNKPSQKWQTKTNVTGCWDCGSGNFIIECGLDYFIMKKFMVLSVRNCSILSLVKIYLVLWIKQPTTSVEEGSNKSIQYKYTQVIEVLLTK